MIQAEKEQDQDGQGPHSTGISAPLVPGMG